MSSLLAYGSPLWGPQLAWDPELSPAMPIARQHLKVARK